MSDIAELLILLAALLYLAWVLWSLRAIRVVGRQRMAMLDRLDPTSDTARAELYLCGAIGWDEHKREVFWLRDPRRLYEALVGPDDAHLAAALEHLWPKGERL